MTDINYNDHAPKTAPTVDDFIPIWDVAAAQSKKATINNILNARLTDGGVVATGGFTLTVPATGTVALRDAAQTFTRTQTVAPPGVDDNVFVLDAPASHNAETLVCRIGTTPCITVRLRNGATTFIVNTRNLGNNIAGPTLLMGRNSNTDAEGPVAGTVQMARASGAVRFFWVDASDNLRIHSAAPTGSSGSPTVSDTAGTVVGTQTSMAAAKHIMDGLSPLDEVAARVRGGAEAVRRFMYCNGSYGGEQFEGVVTDLAPHYGMDRDKYHPQGKSLNEIQIVGDLLRMVDNLTRRVAELEGRV